MEASLRENLAEQIASAQIELHATVSELRTSGGDSGLIAQGEGQLGALSALQRQVGSASPAALAGMRATIAASVAASNMLAQQARATAGSAAQSAGSVQLAAASAAAREAVTSFERDMYERKIFDPYLHFTSKEDEEAYRKREAEREKATNDALAKNTPEGDLRANQLSLDQLKDAGAHGADASPEFETMRRKLQASQNDLAGAITASQTAPRDQANSDKDIAADVAPAAIVPDSVLAALRAAGVKPADPNGEGHGVQANKVQDRSTGLSA